MSKLDIREGRVCIIKVKKISTVKDGLEQVKTALIDFSTSTKVQESGMMNYIFIDLSPFNIINSSLIGILGSIIMDQKIHLLGLCGVQSSVADILKRFGVISDEKRTGNYASAAIKDNISKVAVFASISAGLASLDEP